MKFGILWELRQHPSFKITFRNQKILSQKPIKLIILMQPPKLQTENISLITLLKSSQRAQK